jgi:hypothetical protein
MGERKRSDLSECAAKFWLGHLRIERPVDIRVDQGKVAAATDAGVSVVENAAFIPGRNSQ